MPVLALLEKYGITRGQLSLISQPPNMQFLINRQVDAAMTTVYRELYELRDAAGAMPALSVIDFNGEETAPLEDGLVAREEWVNDPRRLDLLVRFLRASLRGWEFCRDNLEGCADILTRHGPRVEKSVLIEMIKQINRLISGPQPPTPPMGFMDPTEFARSVDLLTKLGAIKPEAAAGAYTHKVWTAAVRGQ